jgi:hypothetical protein
MRYKWEQGEWFGRIDTKHGTIEFIETSGENSLYLNGVMIDVALSKASRLRAKLGRLYGNIATSKDYRYLYDHLSFGNSQYNKERVQEIFMDLIPEHFL